MIPNRGQLQFRAGRNEFPHRNGAGFYSRTHILDVRCRMTGSAVKQADLCKEHVGVIGKATYFRLRAGKRDTCRTY